MSRLEKILLPALALLFLAAVGLVTFGQAVSLDLSHDEHQFIAPAVLLAREGLLPYRDVPLFHQPYLILLDALVVKNTASPLLATRLISGTAAFATGLLIFGCAWRAARRSSPGWRLTAAGSLTLLWLTSYLFLVSSGRTWNHDLPSLLACGALAILLFCEKPGTWHWLAAGLLAGLATGGRLTVAPFAGLLPLSALLWSALPWRQRWRHLAAAAAGVALALLPSAWFYGQSPDNFVFGNFEFPRLPLLEKDNSRILKTITPWRKLRFFLKEVVRSNLPLMLGCGWLCLSYFSPGWRKPGPLRPLPWRWLVPSLALLAGAFAPSRYEMQHFYLVAPLAALLAARALPGAAPRIFAALAVAALAGLALGGGIFANAGKLFDRDDWDTNRMQRQAWTLQSKIPRGKVLTLAPIVPLEAGLSIYPAFATGPFGWNFAYLVPAARRKKLGLLADEDLASALAADPPAAIITGVEDPKLEKPLIRFAKKLHFVAEPLEGEEILWRLPVHAAD